MNKNTWIAAAAFGLVVALPSAAFAHGDYLQAVSDATEGEFGGTACNLPGEVCGLCHQPNSGDPLVDIVVGFKGIETSIRDRAFYDSLTGAGGWDHSAHMPGNEHVNDNRALLEDEVLPAMIADMVDSDGDSVGDLEELSLGYNPLVAYDEADPEGSQLCGDADPFPDVGATSGSTGGGESTGGGAESTGGEGSTGGDPTTGGPDPDTGTSVTPDPTTGDPTSGSGSSGGSGSETGSSDDDSGGCRVAGSGYDPRILGMLLMLGLVAGRRRRR